MNWQYTDHNLGQLAAGDVVEVCLQGSAANVRLLETHQVYAYRNGDRSAFTGILADRSPVRLSIPRAGNWHVIIDLIGLRGQTRSAVRLLQRSR